MKHDALSDPDNAKRKKIIVVANEDEWEQFAASTGAEAVEAHSDGDLPAGDPDMGMEGDDSAGAASTSATGDQPQDRMVEEPEEDDVNPPTAIGGTPTDAILPGMAAEQDGVKKFILQRGQLNLEFLMMTYTAASIGAGSQESFGHEDATVKQSLAELMTEEGMRQVIFVGTQGKEYLQSNPSDLAPKIAAQLTQSITISPISSRDITDVEDESSATKPQLELNNILLLTLPQPGLLLHEHTDASSTDDGVDEEEEGASHEESKAEKSGLMTSSAQEDIFKDCGLSIITTDHPQITVTHMSLHPGDDKQLVRHFLKQQCREDLENYRDDRQKSDKRFSGSIFGCPRPKKIEAVNGLLASLQTAEPKGDAEDSEDSGKAMVAAPAQRGFFARKQIKRALGQGKLGEIVEKHSELLDDDVKTGVIRGTLNG